MKLSWDKETTTKTLSNIIVVLVGIAFCYLLFSWPQIKSSIGVFSSIVVPFVYGFVIAYLLAGPVNYFERRLLRFMDQNSTLKRFKRMVAILLVMVLAFMIIVALLSVVVPQLFDSLLMLINNIQGYITGVEQWAQQIFNELEIGADVYSEALAAWEKILNTAGTLMVSGMQSVLSVTGQVTSMVLNAFVAVIVAIYLLSSKEVFFAQMKKVLYAFLPEHVVKEVIRIGHMTNRTFNGFINGKIIDSVIIGIICFVCLQLFNMPYALLVSVIIGVTNIIPFFGPFIGAIPSTFIIFIVDPIKALWFLVFILLLQQFDGNILGPKILGNTTGLPAIWVLFAILIGGGMAGFVGMIIGVPTFAVLYTLFKEYLAYRLEKKGLSKKTGDYKPSESAE